MQQVNKIKLVKIHRLLFVGVCVVIGTIRWFYGITQENLNIDEPVWVGMTEFYKYRINHNWEKFQLTQSHTRSGYGNERNLLTDQPQAGKYLQGAILGIASEDPWEKQDISWVYQKFSKMELPTDQPLNQLKNSLGVPLVQSISILRITSSIFGFICIGIFSLISFFYFKNIYVASYTFLVTIFNPLILNYFRKAITDSPSTLFIFISGILIWIGIEKLFRNKSACLLVFCCAGLSSAIAASIKINGFFLLGLPVILFVSRLLIIQKSNKKFIFLSAISTITFHAIFLAIFFFLEPVTWNHPLEGLQALFMARLTQQQRFFYAFGKIPYYQMPFVTLNFFFSQFSGYMAIPIFIFLTIGFETFINSVIRKRMYEIQIFSVLLFLFVVNFYYARTGFDRYLIPSVFGLTFISSVGFKIFLEKIHAYTLKIQSLL